MMCGSVYDSMTSMTGVVMVFNLYDRIGYSVCVSTSVPYTDVQAK